MSLTTRSKNCYHCCSMNSTSIVFDKRYFTESFKYMHLLFQTRTFPFETLKPVLSLSAKFKKNNFRRGHLSLTGVDLRA